MPDKLPKPSHSSIKYKPKLATKVGFSESRLANAEQHIYQLAKQFQEYLYLPDPGPLYALMGAVAGNMLNGHPVWLMLVGASGGGKTEFLRTLGGISGMHIRSSIKGEAALLSGVKASERAVGSKGGLLREIGKAGGLINYDFTSVLSLPKDAQTQLLAALREIHDGEWSRQVGTEGGAVLEWTGRIGYFGGVTPESIDRAHDGISEMGERLIFYRMEETDGWGECFTALGTNDISIARENLRHLVEAMFIGLGLSWERTPRRDLNTGEKNQLIALAQFASRSRSGVSRDNYKRDIVQVPVKEAPQKIVNAFSQLYLGMEAVGVVLEDRWKVLRKIAIDCMSLNRRTAFRLLLDMGAQGMTTGEVGKGMQVSQSTVQRTLEDLAVHGVVEKVKGSSGGGDDDDGDGDARVSKGRWKLTAWTLDKLEAAK